MTIFSEQPTVSLGIPAHNEASNIGRLLDNIARQRQGTFHLLEVIVFSDNSTDATNEIVTAWSEKGVRLIDSKERQGVNTAQNSLVREAKGDIVVLLNADVQLVGDDFLEHLIAPIIQSPGTGLVGAVIDGAPARSYFESVIGVSHECKKAIYQRVRGKDNVYLCHGRARAFSRALYSVIVWPEGIPEDAYSYLFCKQRGLNFVLADEAHIIFRSPATFMDHAKQSQRFFSGKQALKAFFGREQVEQEYTIPKKIIWEVVCSFFFRFPIRMTLYSVVFLVLFILPAGARAEQSRWEGSLSTKRI